MTLKNKRLNSIYLLNLYGLLINLHKHHGAILSK